MTDQHGHSIAIVGATGAVGRELIQVLARRAFPMRELRLLASPRSAGLVIELPKPKHDSPHPGGLRRATVQELTPESFAGVDIALFAAGGSISREFAPIAVQAGATVIDNSSAFRMDPEIPLVVPEVNGKALGTGPRALGAEQRQATSSPRPKAYGLEPRIIANPNCSTIIALLVIAPLHRAVGVERMVVSTYQAASGGGAALMNELEQQARDYAAGKPFRHDILGRPYLFNIFSHNSPIGPDGSNEEEAKLVRETHKILGNDAMAITATCVRVPTLRAHCEAINLTLAGDLSEDDAREILRAAPGVDILDDRDANRFPEPIHASGRDDVHVGRIRADHSQPPGRGLNLFVAGDQLRKGAALNAVQIAELIAARKTTSVPVGADQR